MLIWEKQIMIYENELKICKGCKESLPIENFGWSNKKQNILMARCRKCHANRQKVYQKQNSKKIKQYQKEYSENNKEKISKQRSDHYQNNKEKISKRQKEFYTKNKEKIDKLKSVPCVDCGNTFPTVCMNFDHVRGRKMYNIANMKSQSWELIEEEIKKCDVICSNCHRIRTHGRLTKKAA
jgi:ATP-dependent 26S proteasome regulatory subunit